MSSGGIGDRDIGDCRYNVRLIRHEGEVVIELKNEQDLLYFVLGSK